MEAKARSSRIVAEVMIIIIIIINRLQSLRRYDQSPTKTLLMPSNTRLKKTPPPPPSHCFFLFCNRSLLNLPTSPTHLSFPPLYFLPPLLSPPSLLLLSPSLDAILCYTYQIATTRLTFGIVKMRPFLFIVTIGNSKSEDDPIPYF